MAPIFDTGIPHFATEDDAVRAFMHLVRHREVTAALMATPPNVSSLFKPDVTPARKIVGNALEGGTGVARSDRDICAVRGLFHSNRAYPGSRDTR